MKSFLIIVVLVLSITGCGVLNSRGPANNLSESKSALETRLYLTEECNVISVSKGVSPLLAAFIPSLIDVGYKSITNAVKKAGELSEYQETSFTDGYFYEVDLINKGLVQNGVARCLIIVRAEFLDEPVDTEGETINTDKYKQSSFAKESKLMNFLEKKVGVAAKPEFYYEGELAFIAQDQAFRVESRALFYENYFHKKGGKDRDLLLALEFKDPVQGKVFSTATILFNDLVKGQANKGTAIDYKLSSWMPVMPLTGEAAKVLSTSITLLDSVNQAEQEICNDKKGSDEIKKALLGLRPDQDIKTKCKNTWPAPSFVLEGDYKQEVAALDELKTKLKALHRGAAKTELKKIEIDVNDKAGLVGIQKNRAYAGNRLAKLNTQEADDKFANAIKNIGLFEVHLTITETKDGNAFLAKLGEVMEGSQESVTTLLKQKYDPATKEQLKKAEEEANKARFAEREALALKYRTEIKNAKLYKIDIDLAKTEKEKIIAQFNLDEARVNARALAIQLGYPEPTF